MITGFSYPIWEYLLAIPLITALYLGVVFCADRLLPVPANRRHDASRTSDRNWQPGE